MRLCLFSALAVSPVASRLARRKTRDDGGEITDDNNHSLSGDLCPANGCAGSGAAVRFTTHGDATDQFWLKYRANVLMACRHFGITCTWDWPAPGETEALTIERLARDHPGEPIVATPIDARAKEQIETLLAAGTPVITYNIWAPDLKISPIANIAMDDRRAGEMAARKMYDELGVRNPAFVDHGTPVGCDHPCSESKAFGKERFEGFRREFEKHKITPALIPLDVTPTSGLGDLWSWEAGPTQLRELYLKLLEQQADGTYRTKYDGIHAAGGSSLKQIVHLLTATNATVPVDGSGNLERTVIGSNDSEHWMGPLMESGLLNYTIEQRAFLQAYITSSLASLLAIGAGTPHLGSLEIKPNIINNESSLATPAIQATEAGQVDCATFQELQGVYFESDGNYLSSLSFIAEKSSGGAVGGRSLKHAVQVCNSTAPTELRFDEVPLLEQCTAKAGFSFCLPPPPPPNPRQPVGAIVGGAVGGIVFLSLVIFFVFYRKWRRDLEIFKESLVGVFAVTRDYDPRQDADVGAGEISDCPFFQWFWQEDAERIHLHDPADKHHTGNFISYTSSVCSDLDAAYYQYEASGEPVEIMMNLMGIKRKSADPRNSGVMFRLNFERMVQINAKTGFERKVMRLELQPVKCKKKQISSEGEESSRSLTVVRKKKGPRLLNSSTQSIKSCSKKPEDIYDDDDDEGEDLLILRKGQLLQISKQGSDGWAFGSVVFDEMENRPPISIEGLSTQAGWFPRKHTKLPTSDQLASLHKQMGDNATAALAPPSSWSPMADTTATAMKELEQGEEKSKVVRAFMNTLPSDVRVITVQRIQNASLWQSYAVKRQTVLEREKEELALTDINNGTSQYEHVWLFHGTNEETVPKICEMGFNRSFCGKHGTMYGKGVYFARDASYSLRATYSRPNRKGEQHMFVVRVVVGKYCLGTKDVLAPEARQGHQLYDSTVNDTIDPSIFVTYHDAQAYPEYLIKFKQTKPNKQ